MPPPSVPKPARSFFRRWFRRLFVMALLGIAASVAAVGLLRWVDPPASAFMAARWLDGRTGAASAVAIDYRWRDWSALGSRLPVALVAAEDQKFPQHSGFDFDAIDDALAAGGKRRGASTISQQVAKNLFLWSGRSWVRKGLEAWFTVLIEALWPKRRVLEVYANVAEFGDGVYGAEAAAQRYFGKPAASLSAAEAARLAAVLPSPKRYSAEAPGPYVRKRQAWIEGQVRQLGGAGYLRDCCGE